MKNRSIIKREELCNSLSMDFDEASELFSRETMQSMQMVKVNGGIVISGTVIAVAGLALTAIAVGVSIYATFFKSDSTNDNVKLRLTINGDELEMEGKLDRVNMTIRTNEYEFRLGNGSVDFSNWWNPTPQPTDIVQIPYKPS